MSGLPAPSEISTARLILRKPRLDDAAPLFHAYTQDRKVVRFLTWQAHESESETEQYLRYCLGEWATGSSFPYVIDGMKEASGPLGMIHLRPKSTRVEFGYVLARPHWGQGYMSEALTVLVDWSLVQPGIWRASAFCDVENLASGRVMEKAGMTYEGILRRFFVHPNLSPEPRDCRLYAKVRP